MLHTLGLLRFGLKTTSPRLASIQNCLQNRAKPSLGIHPLRAFFGVSKGNRNPKSHHKVPMPVPVVELITFTPSAAYAAAPSVSLNNLFDLLAQTKGHIDSFHGLQVEDSRQGHIVILWETHQHHVALQQSPQYQALRDALSVIVEGQRQMVHVLIQHDCSKVFTAPHVGIVTNTVKDVKNIALLKHHLDALVSQSFDGVVAHTCGPVLEDERKIVLFAAWKSHEHREKLKQDMNPELEKLIGDINLLADVHVRHVKFKKHSA